jgi:predicted permease
MMSVWHRLVAIVWRRKLERDLDDELSLHLAMREAEYVRDGVPADRARNAARRQFGNVTHVREQTHDIWTFRGFESLRQDVRFAGRTLRKFPGFTIVAVGVLALGIGGNTAIFSLVDAVRGHALPYDDPDRLVQLWGNVTRARVERRGASYPDYQDWRARAKSFEDMAAVDTQRLTLSGGDETERIQTEFVSSPYFSLLGISAARGRTFSEAEDTVGKPAYVTVLSDGLWKRLFASDPNVIGRAVTLNAQPYTVVGVMPPAFKGLSDDADLWVPFALYAPPSAMAQRGSRRFAALARLKAGVTLTAAQAEMDGIARQLEQEHPTTNEQRGIEVSPLDAELFGELRPALLMLMAAVVCVLFIACANVANLLIARSETRRREVAVRTAIGANRGRLLRQLITESCLLTGLGAVAGLLCARAAVTILITQSPVAFPSFVTPELDVRVAAFTIAVSLVCGILVGLAPSLQVWSVDLNGVLKDAARGSDGRHSQRLRSALVVAELAMAVVLLVGAGLMIRSVRNLIAVDPGFSPAGVLTLGVSIPRANAPLPQPPASGGPSVPAASVPPVIVGTTLMERVRAIPGVTAVAIATDLPLDGSASASFYAAEGMPDANAQTVPRAYVHRISPAFFTTLRIPIVAGRTFSESELTTTSPAVIVSKGVVDRFWPGQDPVGKRLKLGPLASSNPWMTIVGVVVDVKYRGLPENPTADPDIYLPFAERNSQYSLVVRASVPPSTLVAPVRALVRSIDPSIPVYNISTMAELIGARTSRSRFTMWLMAVFAAVALSLAAIGTYGVMSYLVSERRREIGIRLALGAKDGDILRLIVGNGARLIAAGVSTGVVATFALQPIVSSLLFGVTTVNAASVVAIAMLVAVALSACYLPAVRATRIDPLNALRYE